MELLFQFYPHAFAENSLEKIASGNYTSEDVLIASAGLEGGEKLLPFLKNPTREDVLRAAAILAARGECSSATAMISDFLTGKTAWEIVAYCAASQGEIDLLQKALKKAFGKEIKAPPFPDLPVMGFLNYGKSVAFIASLGYMALEGYSTYYLFVLKKDPLYGTLSSLLLLNHLGGNARAIEEFRKEYYRKKTFEIIREQGKLSRWLFFTEPGYSF